MWAPAMLAQGDRDAFADTSYSLSQKMSVQSIQYDRSRVRKSVSTLPPRSLLSALTFSTRRSICTWSLKSDGHCGTPGRARLPVMIGRYLNRYTPQFAA